MFNKVTESTGSQAAVQTEVKGLAQEGLEMKHQIHKLFGWHFLAKEVADFAHVSFWEAMYMPAVDIAGITAVIAYKTLYNQYNNG